MSHGTVHPLQTLHPASENELVETLKRAAQEGSRLVVRQGSVGAVDPADVVDVVVEPDHQGIDVNTDGCAVDDMAFCGAPVATVAAGQEWDALVTLAVDSGWVGLEALAGIPGRVGAVVADNVTAHGQQPSDTVASVRTWDRQTQRQRTFPMIDCEFAPGRSRFQELLDDGTVRYVVLDVAFLFQQGDVSAPMRDEGLAAALGARVGARVPLAEVREAALGLTRGAVPTD